MLDFLLSNDETVAAVKVSDQQLVVSCESSDIAYVGKDLSRSKMCFCKDVVSPKNIDLGIFSTPCKCDFKQMLLNKCRLYKRLQTAFSNYTLRITT